MLIKQVLFCNINDSNKHGVMMLFDIPLAFFRLKKEAKMPI